jgi:hypothetical protein
MSKDLPYIPVNCVERKNLKFYLKTWNRGEDWESEIESESLW